jgi:hypothetical protein
MPFGELEVYVEGALGIKNTSVFGTLSFPISCVCLSVCLSDTQTLSPLSPHLFSCFSALVEEW